MIGNPECRSKRGIQKVRPASLSENCDAIAGNTDHGENAPIRALISAISLCIPAECKSLGVNVTMSKATNLLACLAASVSFSTAVQAATEVIGVIYEGGVGPSALAPEADRVLGDFNATPGNPELIVIGDVSIWGGVAHSRNSRYTDAWAMDFGADSYSGTFNWQNVEQNPFDGELIVNGVVTKLGDSGTVSLTGLSGYVTFEVDPRKGIYGPSPREAATWDLHLVAMPLPAGAWLMLSGIAGLGLMRRRKKSA